MIEILISTILYILMVALVLVLIVVLVAFMLDGTETFKAIDRKIAQLIEGGGRSDDI